MKNKKYCVYCGTVHSTLDKRCKKCLRSLDPKNQPVKEYLLKQGYGEIEDTALTFLKHYIKSHLYGLLLTCSVILTGASFITHAISNDTSYIHPVTERPSILAHDTGDNHNENESFFDVALSYVDALQKGNEQEASRYFLENTYPDLFMEIGASGEMKGSSYLEHKLFKYHSGLFPMPAEGDYHINKNKEQKMYLGKYPFRTYEVYMNYCSFNTCKMVDSKQVFDFTVAFSVEIIEVEGKYYVFRDVESYPFGFKDNLLLDVLLTNGGDTSQINFDGIEERYRNCVNDHPDEYCLNNILH